MQNSPVENTAFDTSLAIIGMSCRFPGASSLEAFWQNIAQGVKSIHFFSDRELLAAGVEPSLLSVPNYVRAAALLEGIDLFDAAFFGFTRREAEIMDPQHRLFLECAWEALESAAYTPDTYTGLIGVFAGSGLSTYAIHNLYTHPELVEALGELQINLGNERDSLASMVSYKLNLKGPGIAVQTFCSTSLVAVHLACQSLLTYECDIALAGGVAISVPQERGYCYEEGGILSPDGECRTFDARARGSVMGNGAGVVALKRLSDALEDGDHIYAVIRGSAVNNDGNLRVSYTAPGLGGQTAVIAEALGHAGVDPETITYLEAHGTATMLGDAVELAAMIKAFGKKTQKKRFCAIGSVKPNIGHLDRAAGIAGLIKTTLALRQKQLPPSLNFERTGDDIDLENSPFYVNTTLQEWSPAGACRRAGVSAFGLGGTNAHVIVEEAPASLPSSPSSFAPLLVLSARTETALRSAASRLAAHLGTHPQLNLTDVAYTLQVGRSAFNYRATALCRSREEAITALEQIASGQASITCQTFRDPPVIFLLSGQGVVGNGFAQELYRQEPRFREIVDRCCRFLKTQLRLEIDELFTVQPEKEQERQVAAFISEYALAQLFMSWGIRAQALYGYGTGEYVAACLSGVLALEDALTLIVQPDQSPAMHLSPSLSDLLQETGSILFEVGDGRFLSTKIRQHPTCTAEHRLIPALALEDCAPDTMSALLTTLARLWLAGVTVNWATLYAGERRQRVPLPTYPFERQRYWIEPAEKQGQPGKDAQPATGKLPDIADWFYKPAWEEQPLALSVTAPLQAQNPGSPWLIFTDTCGLGDQLAERLRQAGHTVIQVRAGAALNDLNEYTCTIRPAEPSDYTALCRMLASHQLLPGRIIHCWSLTGEEKLSTGPAAFRMQQEKGFYSLLFLAQALGMYIFDEPVQLSVITDRMQAVNAGEDLSPEKNTLVGACKVVSQENMSLVCRSIDVLLLGSRSDPVLVDQLLAELTSIADEPVIAYRGQRRWIQTYQPARLLPVETQANKLRQKGVYLITGGLGRVGLILARYLAETLQARLILLSRSGLPPKSEWSAWLAQHAPDDAVSESIRQVQAMELLGAEVLVMQGDVANSANLQAAIERAYARFGALHGVIHAAGISTAAAFQTVQEIDRTSCDLHFQSKVYGLYALEQALEGCELDFCILFSSVSAVLGGLSLAGYAAANLFMDAFVYQHNRRHSTHWKTVNWDSWQVQGRDHGVLGGTLAQYAMTAAEGIEAFRRILASDASHMVNSTGNLAARIRQWVMLEGIRKVGAEKEEPSGAALSASTRRGHYERVLKQIWQEALGLEEVGLSDNFFDVGGNSLSGLQVLARLRKSLQVQIPITALFEAPSISAMLDYLLPASQPETVAHGALLEQRRQRARQQTRLEGGDIALIGMSGRFPGAGSIEQFWHNLREGVESVTFFSDEQLLAAGVPAALLNNPDYIKARPLLPDGLVEGFDAAFFGYSPREAQLLDPQHRLFLECCWEALERAGYDPARYAGLIGVFGGANLSSYLHSILQQPELVASLHDLVNGYQISVSTDKDALTTTVSYKLNLRGPSLAVQSFCSTSLVAVHLACQSLRQGESDLALAGGVSVRVPLVEGYVAQPGGQESHDGHCRSFDAQATGTLFGDGVGVVVLKRLSEAVEDGDTILAVIKGSAINNDGSLKVSYSAPSVGGQAEVVKQALENAGIEAESISYVEAHGSATELGDPIEIASLSKAFEVQTGQVGYCAIGSLKSNVGHLDRAAGVGGLIKTVLALHHEQLPPSLHYRSPNPQIDFARSPFFVNTHLRPWPRGQQPRRAGVNALGMGGTNAHVIVQEAPLREPSGPSRPWQLLLLSARTPSALKQMSENLAMALREQPELPLADVAYTLQVGRHRFAHRRMLVCRTHEEAIHLLEQGSSEGSSSFGGKPENVGAQFIAPAGTEPGHATSPPTGAMNCAPTFSPVRMQSRSEQVWNRQEERTEREVVFLFPGVGEYNAGVALQLYQQEATFRTWVDRCCALLQPILGCDLRDILFPPELLRHSSDGQAGAVTPDLRALLRKDEQHSPVSRSVTERLKRTEFAQPALFVIEYALAQLLVQWGIRPSAMLGYSLGEYVAACLGGVFSLEDALMLVARRAQLIQQQPCGKMIAVALSEEEILPYLGEDVSLAAVNAPSACVLAGTCEAIERLEYELKQQQISFRPVETTHAFHSHMLMPLWKSLLDLAAQVKLHPPAIPCISNVTGTWLTAEEATDPAYWARHMCQTVRLADGIEHLLREPERVLLEVGPGQSLGAYVRQHPACAVEQMSLVYATSPVAYDRQSEGAFLLTTLGRLWQAGVDVDWSGYYVAERRQRVLLPTYPFERQRYWIAADKIAPAIEALVEKEGEKSTDLADWFYLPSWRQSAILSPSDRNEHDAQCWLLFIDTGGPGQGLAEQLTAQGQDIVTVTAGSAFSGFERAICTIRPTAYADYEAMLRELRSLGKVPQQIVHMWMVGQSEQDDELDRHLERGFYSLITLAQALGNLGMDSCKLTVISSDVQDVTGNEALCPAKATVLGPCKVIPQEYPEIRCRAIDIARGQIAEETLVYQLLGELTAGATESVVALRGRHRWVQSFEPLKLAKAGTNTGMLRSRGVYLITGGLGGIGLALAEYLAKTVKARLVLVGRSGLPPRDEWPQILSETTAIARCIQRVQQLEELGAEVEIMQADVSDEARMREVIQQTLATFGALHGVLHLAGVPASGLMQLKTPDMAEQVLAPKVRGTLALGNATRDLPLDFLALFSSLCSATGGGPGQVDYCAANAFLDAYAHRHATEHGLTVAIDWGEWQWDAWGDGLAGYPEEAQQYFRQRRQKFGISFAEGIEALQRILQRKLPHLVVSTENFQRVVEGSQDFSITTIMQEINTFRQSRPLSASGRPDLGTVYVAPESEIEQEIATVWGALLGIEQIGIHDNFFELGGHSLMGTQLIARLRQAFQVDIRLATLFAAPTVAGLAIAIEMSLIEEIERLSEGDEACIVKMNS